MFKWMESAPGSAAIFTGLPIDFDSPPLCPTKIGNTDLKDTAGTQPRMEQFGGPARFRKMFKNLFGIDEIELLTGNFVRARYSEPVATGLFNPCRRDIEAVNLTAAGPHSQCEPAPASAKIQDFEVSRVVLLMMAQQECGQDQRLLNLMGIFFYPLGRVAPASLLWRVFLVAADPVIIYLNGKIVSGASRCVTARHVLQP